MRQGVGHVARGVAVALGLAALSGCVSPLASPFSPTPSRRAQDANGIPLPPHAAPLPQAVAQQTAPSLDPIRQRYAALEAKLLARGLLRQEAAPHDAPFASHQLAATFFDLAFSDEIAASAGGIGAGGKVGVLRRWQEPLRVAVEFGASVPEPQRAQDRASVSRFAGQLARASRHPVRMGGAANMTVLIVNEAERRTLGPRLMALVPGLPKGVVTGTQSLAPSTYCMVYTIARDESPSYSQALVVIRAELPPVLRQSCIEEEMAQGMGLTNDSPRARPSLFNDDAEFGRLTRHDALLLQLLYDKRLSAGMAEAEARAIVPTLAAEIMGGDS